MRTLILELLLRSSGSRNTCPTFDLSCDSDVLRNDMLNDARTASAAWSGITGFLPRHITHTCLPRLLYSPVLWLALIAFATTATLTRMGVIDHAIEDYDTSVMANSDLLVSLLMAFYLGYCYTRYYAIYFCLMDCRYAAALLAAVATKTRRDECARSSDKLCGCWTDRRNAVFDCCALAAVYLYDTPDVWRVWRYTNLAHASTMIGISPAYTYDNLFVPFVKENGLLEEEDTREFAKLQEAHMELTGMRAPQACISWALAVVSDARHARRLEKPEGVTLSDKIITLRTSLSALFNFQFQTIP